MCLVESGTGQSRPELHYTVMVPQSSARCGYGLLMAFSGPALCYDFTTLHYTHARGLRGRGLSYVRSRSQSRNILLALPAKRVSLSTVEPHTLH